MSVLLPQADGKELQKCYHNRKSDTPITENPPRKNRFGAFYRRSQNDPRRFTRLFFSTLPRTRFQDERQAREAFPMNLQISSKSEIWRRACLLSLALLLGVVIALSATVRALASVPNLPAELREKATGKMVLLDFYSPYCGTCRMMEPHLGVLQGKTKDRIVIKHVNVGVEPGSQYLVPFEITGTPTYVLYNPDGKAVYRMTDLISPTILQQQVLRSLGRLKPVTFPKGVTLPAASQKPAGEIGDMILLSLENKQCAACQAMQPYLSGFEMTGTGSGLQILHLDTDTPDGKKMMETLKIKALPAYILLDNTAVPLSNGAEPVLSTDNTASTGNNIDNNKEATLSRGEIFRLYGPVPPRKLWDIIRLFARTGV
jgi:thiol-disulfide isomerase/thioredoxin